ncbi:hypothetical protein GH714_022622 [Hevea brasiliensis]|uniref:Uncharacterized protein n=1 Tax=Hevea brasiliensis TaxID=3981 RepID=A0A6A6MYJ7_HEVBR|nr:hypothetical protein GH714_022622 [Hevea brasiliensis]
MLARLEGHKKSVVGVALPSRSDKLYTGSRDGTVRVWDCYSGKCDRIINLGFEIGSLICEGLWVFIGLPNLVRVWNLSSEGSMDNTVKVWDLETMQCKQTLNGHKDVMMSLLSWDQCLLTCSLEHTMKFWVAREGGKLEPVNTHEEKSGILKVLGMQDAKGKHNVLCSYNDNCFRLYELDSFTEMDRIFAEKEVREIQRDPMACFSQVMQLEWLLFGCGRQNK